MKVVFPGVVISQLSSELRALCIDRHKEPTPSPEHGFRCWHETDPMQSENVLFCRQLLSIAADHRYFKSTDGPKAMDVLLRWLYHDETLDEIALHLNLSYVRIRQLHMKALNTLRGIVYPLLREIDHPTDAPPPDRPDPMERQELRIREMNAEIRYRARLTD